jgi:tetratricopeptide (TPR) repeat protein
LASAAFSHVWAHQYDGGDRCVAAAIASAPPRSPGLAMARIVEGFHHAIEGESAEHEAKSRAGLELCAAVRSPTVEAYAYFNLAQNSEWRGAYGDAIAFAERSMALARQQKLPDSLIFSTWFLAKARCCIGELGGAFELLREAHALCERIGDRAWRSRMLNTLGWCFAEVGAHDLAQRYNERAADLAQQIGDPEIIANAHINLALNHLHQGDLDRALHYFEPIEEAARRTSDPWMRWRYSLHIYDARAEIELARNACDAALPALDLELEGARRNASPKLEARAWLNRGRVLLRMDARDEARAALAEGARLAERIGYRTGQWRALRALADLEGQAGRSGAAARAMADATHIVEPLAASLGDLDLRRRLRATALA